MVLLSWLVLVVCKEAGIAMRIAGGLRFQGDSGVGHRRVKVKRRRMKRMMMRKKKTQLGCTWMVFFVVFANG